MMQMCRGRKTVKRNDKETGNMLAARREVTSGERGMDREGPWGASVIIYFLTWVLFTLAFSLRLFIESCIYVFGTLCLFYWTIIKLLKVKKKQKEKRGENDRYRKIGTEICPVALEEFSRSPTQLFHLLDSPEHSPASHYSNFMNIASCPFLPLCTFFWPAWRWAFLIVLHFLP